MVVVGVFPFALGDGEHLVEVAVAIGVITFLHKSPCRIVGVAGCRAIGRRRDELVRAVEGKGRRFAAHGLPEHIARLVVDVALDVRAILLHREELSTSVVRILLPYPVRRAGNDPPRLRIFVRDRGVRLLSSAEVLARELAVLRVDEVDGRAVYRLPREPPPAVVGERHRAPERGDLGEPPVPIIDALLFDNLAGGRTHRARRAVPVGVVGVGVDEAAFVLLHEPSEVVIDVRLFELLARMRRKASPDIVGEDLGFAVAVVDLGDAVEFVVCAADRPVGLAVLRGGDGRDESVHIALHVRQLPSRGEARGDPEPVPAEPDLVPVLVHDRREASEVVVGVGDLGAVRVLLLHDAPELVAVAGGRAAVMVGDGHGEPAHVVADGNRREDRRAVPALDLRDAAMVGVGARRHDAIGIRRRDKPVVLVVDEGRGREVVLQRKREAARRVRDRYRAASVGDALDATGTGVGELCGPHGVAVRVEFRDGHEPVPAVVGEGADGFCGKRPVRAAGQLRAVAPFVVLEEALVAETVGDAYGLPGLLVVAEGDKVASASVRHLAHLPEVGDVIAHEAVGRRRASREVDRAEDAVLHVAGIGRGPSRLVLQLDAARIGVGEVRIREEPSRDLARVGDLVLPVPALQVLDPVLQCLELDVELLDAPAARRRGEVAVRVGEGLRIERGDADGREELHGLLRSKPVDRLRENRQLLVPIAERDRYAVEAKRGDKTVRRLKFDEARSLRRDGEKRARSPVLEQGSRAVRRLDAGEASVFVGETPAGETVLARHGEPPRLRAVGGAGVRLPVGIGRVESAALLRLFDRRELHGVLRRLDLLRKELHFLAPRRRPKDTIPVPVPADGTLELRRPPAVTEESGRRGRRVVDELDGSCNSGANAATPSVRVISKPSETRDAFPARSGRCAKDTPSDAEANPAASAAKSATARRAVR